MGVAILQAWVFLDLSWPPLRFDSLCRNQVKQEKAQVSLHSFFLQGSLSFPLNDKEARVYERVSVLPFWKGFTFPFCSYLVGWYCWNSYTWTWLLTTETAHAIVKACCVACSSMLVSSSTHTYLYWLHVLENINNKTSTEKRDIQVFQVYLTLLSKQGKTRNSAAFRQPPGNTHSLKSCC